MVIDKRDVYRGYLDLVIHSEKISWGRFGNFLVISSILILAWAKLFAEKDDFAAQIVMSAICFFGILIGFAWSDLGNRSRSYLDKYKAKAKAIEEHHDKSRWWEPGIPITDRPFQIQASTSCWSSSTILLTVTPLLFSVLNLVMLWATWFQKK